MENIQKKTEFLQSLQWRKFQEAVGRKTHFVESAGSSASLIEHVLPIVGKYFYCPRGPIMEVKSQKLKVKSFLQELVELAKKERAGWLRIEPENQEVLELLKENLVEKIVKAPHDVQPKQIFQLDISKNEEQLLVEMKSKTRYNIGVAKKHGVKILCTGMTCHPELVSGSTQIPDRVRNDNSFYMNEFLRLTKEMAARQGITAHPEEYYRKMLETLPAEMLQIYVAEYQGKILAANLVLFFGDTATYLHGASSNEHRNVMAPFLLQWQAILDAKQKGCQIYDFGGVKVAKSSDLTPTLSLSRRGSKGEVGDWAGITQFKLGFSPNTKPVEFPGSYDIIVNPRAYGLYRGLRRAKTFLHRMQK